MLVGRGVLAVDEFEALRLADYEGLYQEQAAERMRISRQTFGRIVEAARKKVAQALVEGLALRIEGGEIEMAKMRAFECGDCGTFGRFPLEPAAQPDVPRARARLSTGRWRPPSANRARRRLAGRSMRARAGVGSSATARAAVVWPSAVRGVVEVVLFLRSIIRRQVNEDRCCFRRRSFHFAPLWPQPVLSGL